MKRLYNYLPVCVCVLALLTIGELTAAQETTKQDSTRNDVLVTVGYHNVNNQWSYLSVHAKAKLNGKFQSVKGAKFHVYLDKDSAGTLVGDLVTDDKGDAVTTLKPSLKDQWKSGTTHTFIALYDGDAHYNASKTEAVVKEARLKVDTAEGRNIVVSVEELKDGAWTPVKAVEIKVAVKRLQSDMPVSDKESFTTDSTGKITAEFKRDGLPGGDKGLLTLIAKVEDNDTYGNLQVEKTVPWGAVLKPVSNFDERSLWAARFKTPVWLLLMEYFIFFSVWSVLIYLVFQIARIKKAGMPG
ncbi:MAG TPA: hypothetical protein VL832_00445 [Puia sp.]|jgi:hypothetical protein|nr:hypothetical protein [Puia sp.]